MSKRKISENSLKNLQKGKPFDENCKEIARKAQEKSVIKRAERKKLRECLELALSIQNSETGEDNAMTITKALINQAIKGNVQAYQVIRDTIGEKPTDKQEIQNSTTNYYPKVFVMPEDLKNPKKLEQLLNKSKYSEIIYVSPEAHKEIDEYIDSIIN